MRSVVAGSTAASLFTLPSASSGPLRVSRARSEPGFKFVDLAHPVLNLRVGRVLADAAHRPAQHLRAAARDARGDQRVHGGQVDGPEPRHDGGEFLRRFIQRLSGPAPAADLQDMTAGLLRPVRAVSLELHPRDDAGQFVGQLPEALAGGFLERTDDLLVRFPAPRLVRPGEEDPDRDVSRLYRRVIPVLQYLDPADCAIGKDRPDVLLDAGGPGLRHHTVLTCKICAHNACKPCNTRYCAAVASSSNDASRYVTGRSRPGCRRGG